MAEREITVTDLAEASGVAERTLYRWRAGDVKKPNGREITSAALALHITPQELRELILRGQLEQASEADAATEASQATASQATASQATATAPTLPAPNLGTSTDPALTPGQDWLGPVDHHLDTTLEIAADGTGVLEFHHRLHNQGSTPITRLPREMWFEQTAGDIRIEPSANSDRQVIIQRIHDTASMAKFACQLFPALAPGESATVGYRCEGGRFTHDHYWRQSIVRPTGAYTLTVRQHGVKRIQRCSLIRERADGSEVIATDSLALAAQNGVLTLQLRQQNLSVGEAVTLRWEVTRVDP